MCSLCDLCVEVRINRHELYVVLTFFLLLFIDTFDCRLFDWEKKLKAWVTFVVRWYFFFLLDFDSFFFFLVSINSRQSLIDTFLRFPHFRLFFEREKKKKETIISIRWGLLLSAKWKMISHRIWRRKCFYAVCFFFFFQMEISIFGQFINKIPIF